MMLEGGCYCRAVRYEVSAASAMRAQCHCRECQYISGGGPNLFMLVSPETFRYTHGAPKTFTRSDIPQPVTREFCAECGTHMVTKRPGLPQLVLKVGTLDDPSVFGTAQFAVFTIDKQPFHHIPEGLPAFERLPKR